jgi:hypothetical protein
MPSYLTYEEAKQRLRRISAMPLEEVKSTVTSWLSNPEIFRCDRDESRSPTDLEVLAPELKHLLQRCRTIELVGGDTRISRDELRPSSVRAGFWRIGTDYDGVEIVVSPGHEAVYQVDGAEPGGYDFDSDASPTIYHYLFDAADLVVAG